MRIEKVKGAKRGNKRKRRGFSLVEVVIALTVITIISSAALSLVLSSAKSDDKALRTTQVMIAADNALECFEFADTEEEFATLIKKTGDYSLGEDGKYVCDENSYVVTVSVDYSTMTMSFAAVDVDGKEIYSYVFSKEVT